MLDQDFLRQLSARAATLLPAAEAKRKELEQDMFHLLQSSLGKLNVVTHEQLAAQVEILGNANARIAELERRVAELEARRDGASPHQTASDE